MPADFRCWVHVRTDGIGACVITDEEYPSRVAFALMSKVMDDFSGLHRGAWSIVEKDTVMPCPTVDEAIVKFQDPAEADSLTRIQRELEATKVVLHKSIDSMLERGEKLDTLVEKSNDLNRQSKQFYKVAKKNNACCVIC
jgi:synaptobrevin family protein YKT6